MKPASILEYRKDPRIVITVPIVVFTAGSLVYYLMLRARELSPEALTSRLLLFALWNINIILILGILFVLIRNVIKLFLERQRGIPGVRFRTKLVLTYVATSLVPIAVLFFVATDLLRVSIDRWFNTPVRTILKNSESIAEELQSSALKQAERAATEIAATTADATTVSSIDLALEHVRQNQQVDVAGLYENGAVVRLLADPRAPVHEMREPSSQFFDDVEEEGTAFKIDVTPGGKWIRSGARVKSSNGAPRVALAGVFLTGHVARMIDENMLANKNFEQLDSQRQALKASQTSMFLTVTLYILFGTLWVSIFVSRRITGPVQALAEGTRTLASGNYGHRIGVKATDEIGSLIDSFNAMAEQLEQQREALTESNRAMTEINTRIDRERAYFSTILESVSTGILACDENLVLLSVNHAAVRILGLASPPDPQTPLGTIFTGDLAPLGSYVEEIRKRGPRQREVSLVRDGEIRYLEVSAARMGPSEAPTGWVLAIEDSTTLVQAQKLAAWSEAARRIAHEIKNPLTPIQLSAERIRRKFQKGDPDVGTIIDEGCRTIVNEVGQLKRMVDEFSRFARMPAINLHMSDVSGMLRELAQLYTEVKPLVRLEVDVPDDLQAVIDSEQIRRAVINLLDNAIEATDEGSVRLSAKLKNRRLTISVADTGRGIPDADKERLFIPYFSTKDRGTGLGLAIIHRIVKDHDGRISVHDNRPHGARFDIEIPA